MTEFYRHTHIYERGYKSHTALTVNINYQPSNVLVLNNHVTTQHKVKVNRISENKERERDLLAPTQEKHQVLVKRRRAAHA